MRKERTLDEESCGNYCMFFSYNNIRENINDDFDPSIDFHNSVNIVSRVEYPQDLGDENCRPPQLLNLDAEIQQKSCNLSLNYGDGSSYDRSYFKTEIVDGLEMDESDSWKFKNIEDWNVEDTVKYMFYTACRIGQCYSQIENALVMPGKELMKLSRNEFVKRDKLFGGQLYDLLPKRHCTKNISPIFNTFKSDDESSIVSSTNHSDGESISGSECGKKRRPGRPRISKPEEKQVRVKLWEFVRDLLLDPKSCPTLIRWVDYKTKRFCFVKSDQVAKLWGKRGGKGEGQREGKRKPNHNMTYDKFSRAMRYYYEKDIFKAVIGRRLVYEFGKKATGLETDNPNFANSG